MIKLCYNNWVTFIHVYYVLWSLLMKYQCSTAPFLIISGQLTALKDLGTSLIWFSTKGSYLHLIPQGGHLFKTGRLFIFWETTKFNVEKKPFYGLSQLHWYTVDTLYSESAVKYYNRGSYYWYNGGGGLIGIGALISKNTSMRGAHLNGGAYWKNYKGC